MSVINPRKWTALLASSLLVACGASAQQVSNSALLQLLVKKGLISQAEADQILQEAAQPAPAPAATPASGGGAPLKLVAGPGSKSPLAFQIGSTAFTPLGFMDFTTVSRPTTTGGALGTGFGSIPFNNTAAGQLSETRFSAQNSRLGLRVDSTIGESTKVLGYLETDFLGNTATSQNVTSNSSSLRMRNYFVDVRQGDLEFLAGQDWSMMTPNRKGISPIPGDIFYSQNVDTNYQNGLTWARQAQVRVIYHAAPEWTLGVSAENPDQYIGGGVTLPAGFNASSVDNGGNGTATPNLLPDFVGKIAYDGKLGDLPVHLDAAGLIRQFKVNTLTSTVNANASATGVAGSINGNIAVLPNLLLVGTFFTGDGGGRYLANDGAPDFIVNPANASGVDTLSLVQSDSYILGAEWDTMPANKVYAYYSRADIGRKFVQTGATTGVGYGYVGSSSSDNKWIDEWTFGDTYTVWKNATYGDLKALVQASYINRQPWYIAPGAPSKAHVGMLFFDLRYDLP